MITGGSVRAMSQPLGKVMLDNKMEFEEILDKVYQIDSDMTPGMPVQTTQQEKDNEDNDKKIEIMENIE